MTPTARSLAECKKRGWLAFVCERYNRFSRRRNDAFGFGDVLVMDGSAGSLLIQATSGSNAASRVTKIREECSDAAKRWLRAGNRVQVWSWAKRGARGARKLWTLRVTEIFLAPEDELATHGGRQQCLVANEGTSA